MPWNKRPEPSDSAQRAVTAEDEAYLREQAWEAIAPGFRTRDSVMESMVEGAEYDDESPLTGADARRIVDELWALRLAQLAIETARPRDDERVETAFAQLTAAGIVSTLHLGFDRGEGSDLGRELAERTSGSRGFAYFHAQDADRLAHPGLPLYIGFDALDHNEPETYDAAAVAVGEEVRAALTANGLTVSWDGTVETRIMVTGLDWRRPLPAS